MSENITPDEFGWKLDTYQEVGEQSFGDGDTGEGVSLIFRNPTAPLALIMVVAEVIDYREREADSDLYPSRETLPYAVDERYEFVVFPDAEAMKEWNYDESWQEYVTGEGGIFMHETPEDAKREAVRMVQFVRHNPSMCFQWDGTVAGFHR